MIALPLFTLFLATVSDLGSSSRGKRKRWGDLTPPDMRWLHVHHLASELQFHQVDYDLICWLLDVCLCSDLDPLKFPLPSGSRLVSPNSFVHLDCRVDLVQWNRPMISVSPDSVLPDVLGDLIPLYRSSGIVQPSDRMLLSEIWIPSGEEDPTSAIQILLWKIF